MRLSPTQIAALRLLAKDPCAKVRANVRKALKHRGLVEDVKGGGLNDLGRRALRELDQEQTARPETRIHLMNEPATLAQLRVLKPLLHFEPSNLSKEDASTLISFLKDLKKRPATLESRLPTLGLLLRVGAQALDAIGFSDPAPIAHPEGDLTPAVLAATVRRGRPLVTPALKRNGDVVVIGRPVSLRPRGDIPAASSKAASIFLALASATKTAPKEP